MVCIGKAVLFSEVAPCNQQKPLLQMTGEMLKIPDFPQRSCGVLWDCELQEHDVFIAFDDSKVITYLYNKDSIQGV
jgi:hypothetical protein